MKALCVIPARAGSKRVPGKNVRDFHGRPMLGWPLGAARDSGLFDTVMVSTEDEATADVARGLGAAVPFLRDPATADDRAGLMAVLAEVVETFDRREERFDAVCCLLATAALATPRRLCEGFDLFTGGGGRPVFAVLAYGAPIQRALVRDPDGATRLIDPDAAARRSQDLAPRYFDAGQFYWLTPEACRAGRSPLLDGLSLVLEEAEAQDIDSEADWRLAELKFELRDRR